jgi:hypothetical protein
MTSIGYIDSVGKEEVYKWMDLHNYDTYDSEIYSKWVIIKSLNDEGVLTKEDEYYVKHELFDGLYFTDDVYLDNYVRKNSEMTHTDQVKTIIDLSVDSTGKSIFDTFLKKYRSDDVLGRKRKEVSKIYEDKRMIPQDFTKILGNIDLIEGIIEGFIGKVNTERKFVERSGSGKGDRKIRTSEDWTEAIIEFYSLPQYFGASIDGMIKEVIDTGKIKTYCDSLSYDDCTSPCFRNNGIIKKSCTYDFEKLMKEECNGKEFEDCSSPCNRKIKNRLTGNISCVYEK